MELSVDEKIQAAIQPLLERINALQTEQQHLKQEISSLQSTHNSKIPQKPGLKPPADPRERIHTAKDNKKSSDHHEVKPQGKPSVRPGPKKEEVKAEGEESGKVGAKTPNAGNKMVPSPNVNKDNNDPKNVKPRPTTAVGTKPNTSALQNKSNIHDKKGIAHKTNEAEHEKKEEGEEKKSHHSKEKDHKGSALGLKSPGPAKKVADKKPVVPSPAPAPKKQPVGKSDPKPIQGGKSIKHEAAKQPVAEQTKVEASPTQKDEPIPDEVKEESIALNNPYTPNDESEKPEYEPVSKKVEDPEPQPAPQVTAEENNEVKATVQEVEAVEKPAETEVKQGETESF